MVQAYRIACISLKEHSTMPGSDARHADLHSYSRLILTMAS
jgi:hypothetical protein